MRKDPSKYKCTQTTRDCKTIGTQTEGDSTVKHSTDVSCQQVQNSEEKCFQINLSTLTFEVIYLDDQKVAFILEFQIMGTFDDLFDEMKDDAELLAMRYTSILKCFNNMWRYIQ